MAKTQQKKWFKPLFDFSDDPLDNKKSNKVKEPKQIPTIKAPDPPSPKGPISTVPNINSKNWMKNFEPATVEDLAVHNKKIQEVEQWLRSVSDCVCSNMLLLSGPVGSGKTITVKVLAKKFDFKVTEWITPIDTDIPSENGEYEYKEKQSKIFQNFILNAANFSSLLDNNNKKIVLVEDFPNTFTRTPSELTDVLQQYKDQAKSPIVFICSETHADNINSALNLFTASVKEQYNINHISFNSISVTGLKSALKRVSEIMTKKYSTVYKTPTADLIECVVNSSAGDIRSAVLNFHFACLKVSGTNQSLETSIIAEKESKSKTTKRKKPSSKFTALGKDETVSILHGVGRVLNPKVTNEGGKEKFTHNPLEIIEQFISQPTSFINFLQENYLPHFSNIDQTDEAASALSVADYLVAEWRDPVCQEFGLYVAAAGLMVANRNPVSAWNPVRGPKNMKIQYPSPASIPLMDPDYLYKGKVIVSDFATYCKIININNK